MSSLAADLEKIRKLAYRREAWNGAVMAKFYALRERKADFPDFGLVEKVYPWMLVPLTLWAVNFQALLERLLEQIEADGMLGADWRCIVETLPPLPSSTVQQVVAQHEHDVQTGNYAMQVKAAAKFELREKALLQDAAFLAEWAALKEKFDVSLRRDYKGVIRRTFVAERGFRPEWELEQTEEDAAFRMRFDLFCQKWDLYGMQHERPLLQRLTVNLTPHGTMIFIPSWWSLDGKRDVNWSEVQTLHKARVAGKQGEKLTRNQMEQQEEAVRAAKWNEEAKKQGLRGDKRVGWVAEKMKWPLPDARRLGRLLGRARKTPGSDFGTART